MLSLEEALERVLSSVDTIGAERIPFTVAHRRVAAEDILSSVNLPVFDNSAMDGYAVISADLQLADVNNPIALKCVGEVAAGYTPASGLSSGECLRIFTGSPLPAGADCVVMQEDTRRAESDGNSILFLETPKPWENIRFAGEDVKAGAVIARCGSRLMAGQIALASACGVASVEVGRRPVVGLLATGDELVEPGDDLPAGKIYESNRTMLSAMVESCGGIAKPYPLVPDDLQKTCNALRQASADCDLLITSGAVSVGDHDHVRPAIEKLSGSLDFWRVSVRPGKPFVFGTVGNKPLLGLPGNPVSSYVTFLLLGRPVVLKLQGASEFSLPSVRGELVEPFSNRGNRRHFARVVVDHKGRVRSAGLQASHALSSLAQANALLEVPPESELNVGDVVDVLSTEW